MKLANKIIFVAGSGYTLAVIGMILASIFMPDNIGLAGGAYVLMYGLGGLIVGIVAGIFLSRKLSDSTIQKSNYLYLLILLILIIRVAYVFNTRDAGAPMVPQKPTTEAADATSSTSGIPDPDITAEVRLDRNIGIGMAKAVISTKNNIELYKGPGGKPYADLKFKMGSRGLEYASVPKGFNPEHDKLDYNILFFKIIDQNGAFVEAEINKESKETAWLSKEDLRFLPWSDFLFTVHSIEPNDWENNPVRQRPDISSEPMQEIDRNYILKPLIIQREWIQVQISDQNYQPVGKGWFRWKSDSELMVSYNLLS